MSSLTRRIQRMSDYTKLACRKRKGGLGSYLFDIEGVEVRGRNKSGSGMGSRLGTVNPKDPCRTGKRKEPKKWRSAENAPLAKPKLRFKTSAKASREAGRAAHKAKMDRKASIRERVHKTLNDRRATDATVYLARTNRHTGKPHEHKREIARRLRQRGEGA